MDRNSLNHGLSTYQAWGKVQELLANKKGPIELDGNSLDIPSVVAVTRHGRIPILKRDAGLEERLAASVEALNNYLAKGFIAYGVNTGYGGSADSRTNQLLDLQLSCLQHTQSAIITTADKQGLPDQDGATHVIPKAWTKGAILVRANQNMRGHSAIRLEVIQRLVDLLRCDITPLVPLRGTISASGDLMPMSFIAGAITGNPDIHVRVQMGGREAIVPSPAALSLHNLKPVQLGPKEGLGLINGTAPSAALASLIIYETQQMAALAQVLTAFTTECLAGRACWTDEFIHNVRPHPGQLEAAANIRKFLDGSSLVTGITDNKKAGDGLWQDRYSTRTAPQWIGPYLEDLMLAQQQIEIELNSTSDNPIVQVLPNSTVGEVHSGGNFQATAITSALDKARTALIMIGRMIFSQCTELINPSTNNGLDTNLVFGDPDTSYTMKGIDVNMAAYMSELAALGHPVSAHVMPAEMNNQGINSLAFITGRRTMEALDIISHMCASHTYVCCQAAELRRNDISLRMTLFNAFQDALNPLHILQGDQGLDFDDQVKHTIQREWSRMNTTCWEARARHLADIVTLEFLDYTSKLQPRPDLTLDTYQTAQSNLRELFTKTAKAAMASISEDIIKQREYFNLGMGASKLYNFVRGEEGLGVPPSFGVKDALTAMDGQGTKTIGSNVSIIYESLRSGRLYDEVVMPLLGSVYGAKTAGNGHPNGLNGHLD
jgi:phenylalanine ammonia-lyase